MKPTFRETLHDVKTLEEQVRSAAWFIELNYETALMRRTIQKALKQYRYIRNNGIISDYLEKKLKEELCSSIFGQDKLYNYKF